MTCEKWILLEQVLNSSNFVINLLKYLVTKVWDIVSYDMNVSLIILT